MVWGLLLVVLAGGSVGGQAATGRADTVKLSAERYRRNVEPILKEFCFDCHADGMDKGKVTFDAFQSDADLVGRHDLWLAVLKNLRAGLMPPDNKPRPGVAQISTIEQWIKAEAFQLDPESLDPGRVTVRRLNRVEYRNTIRDLMGHDFKVEDQLPPDDTGYGFDTIGEVLTMSPLLLEKYMQAAEDIVAAAVPRVPWVIRERYFPGTSFRPEETGPTRSDRKEPADRFSFYDETLLRRSIDVEAGGTYRLKLEVHVFGEFDFDPGRCRLVLKSADRTVVEEELSWQNGKRFAYDVEEAWTSGQRSLTLEIRPLVPVKEKKNSLTLQVVGAKVAGPLERQHWVRPKNFELFFTQDPPESVEARRTQARELLGRFVRKAYRRPVDRKTVERLVRMAEQTWAQPGKRFEDGIAQAIVPVLASPRFLFRVEDVLKPAGPGQHPLVDEFALASRLSYFLWSTMPDTELRRLAYQGELRKNLTAQIGRMLADPRSRALVDNFVGQWLQVRDVEGIDINAQVVLSRDAAQDGELQRNRQRFRQLRDIPEEKLTDAQKKEIEELRAQFRRRFGERPKVELDRELRQALQDETELLFQHVLKEDRSVLELLDGRYTFLNERLARHYGLTNLNLAGREMRRVDLPPDSPRGGVLTHGAVLVVTSNPTRTSPVKRGLFILDNILGTPPPPPPANVPPLEDSEKEQGGRTPTLRETLAIHRENALCRSCHNRMDPLGLALENFNALGMWRDQERGQPIDAAGRLATGEPFRDIRDIKKVLVNERHLDFYRCLTEKLLVYALGRGLTYADVGTVDRIVAEMEKSGGRMSSLLMGVIESAPFQKRREDAALNVP